MRHPLCFSSRRPPPQRFLEFLVEPFVPIVPAELGARNSFRVFPAAEQCGLAQRFLLRAGARVARVF